MPDYQYVLYEIDGRGREDNHEPPRPAQRHQPGAGRGAAGRLHPGQGRGRGQGGGAHRGRQVLLRRRRPLRPAHLRPLHHPGLDGPDRPRTSSGPSPRTRRWWWPRSRATASRAGWSWRWPATSSTRASSTKFGVTEITMGILPGWGGTVRLAQVPAHLPRPGDTAHRAQGLHRQRVLRDGPADARLPGRGVRRRRWTRWWRCSAQTPPTPCAWAKRCSTSPSRACPGTRPWPSSATAIAWLFHSRARDQPCARCALQALEAMKKQEQGG